MPHSDDQSLSGLRDNQVGSRVQHSGGPVSCPILQAVSIPSGHHAPLPCRWKSGNANNLLLLRRHTRCPGTCVCGSADLRLGASAPIVLRLSDSGVEFECDLSAVCLESIEADCPECGATFKAHGVDGIEYLGAILEEEVYVDLL